MEISCSLSPSLLHFPSSRSSFLANNSAPTFLKKLGTPRPITSHRRKSLRCTCLFGLGVPELVVIAGVAALVFGPKKLPEVGKSIGKTVKSFQQAAKEFESELKKEPESLSDGSAEKPRVVNEDDKENIKVSSSEESSTA